MAAHRALENNRHYRGVCRYDCYIAKGLYGSAKPTRIPSSVAMGLV